MSPISRAPSAKRIACCARRTHRPSPTGSFTGHCRKCSGNCCGMAGAATLMASTGMATPARRGLRSRRWKTRRRRGDHPRRTAAHVEKLRGEANRPARLRATTTFYRSYVLLSISYSGERWDGAHYGGEDVRVGNAAFAPVHLDASLRQLKPLEGPVRPRCAALRFLAHIAFRDLPGRPSSISASGVCGFAGRLQINGGDDVVAASTGSENSRLAFCLRHIGFEFVAVAEKQFGALAAEMIRGRRRRGYGRDRECLAGRSLTLPASPMLLLAGASSATGRIPRGGRALRSAAVPGFARRIEMADRIETDDAFARSARSSR